MQLAKQLHLQPGSPVRIEIEEGHLIIRPPRYTLSELLEEITPQNMHHLIFVDDQNDRYVSPT